MRLCLKWRSIHIGKAVDNRSEEMDSTMEPEMSHIDPEFIPGTVLLYGSDNNSANDDLLRDGDIILIPQPTISPNDPLTWSKKRKFLNASILLLLRAVLAAGSNVGFAPAPIMVELFGFNFSVFNNLAAIVFASMGGWVFLTCPCPYLYGGRSNYIFGILCGVAGMAWYANVKGAPDVYGAQFFIGIATSCSEAAVILSFSQLFYQHQIDYLVAIYVFVTLIGTFVGPLIAGFVVYESGWQWDGYGVMISYAVVAILVIFFLEETYFDREHFATEASIPKVESIETDETANGTKGAIKVKEDKPRGSISPRQSRGLGVVESNLGTTLSPRRTAASINRPDIVDEIKQQIPDEPKSIWRRLAIITLAANIRGWGFKQYVQRLWLVLRVFTFPPVLFVGIQWGAQMSWITYYMTLESDYWVGPPWNYTTSGVGVMFVPTLIGALCGFIYSIVFVKWFIKRMANRNGGVMEAETRLWCNIPGIILSTVGLIVLGAGTEKGWDWPVPYVMLGFVGFGFGSVGDISMAYCVDCYPEMVLESMVGVAFMYDIICAILSEVCNYWLEVGVFNAMIGVGVVNLFMCCTVFPMMIYGKRCRRWTRDMYFTFVKKRDSLNG